MPQHPSSAFARNAKVARSALAEIAAEKQAIDSQIQQSQEALTEARAALMEAETILRRRPPP